MHVHASLLAVEMQHAGRALLVTHRSNSLQKVSFRQKVSFTTSADDTQRILWSGMLRGSGRPVWPQNRTPDCGRYHSVATQASQSHGACLTTTFVEYRPRLWQTTVFDLTTLLEPCRTCLMPVPLSIRTVCSRVRKSLFACSYARVHVHAHALYVC